MSNDSECVRAVLAGDTVAYGELYDRYARLVRAVCFDWTGDLAEAQDLSQEAFFRAYRRLDSLREPERFGQWLMGVTRMVCREWRRRRLRAPVQTYSLDATTTVAAEASPCESELDPLYQALQSLPDRERWAVHAFYIQEQSTERAMATLGLSRSGLYRVLQRARKRLKKLLAGLGEDGQ